MEGLDSPSYSKLNKKGNLTTPISSGFMTPKLVLVVTGRTRKTKRQEETSKPKQAYTIFSRSRKKKEHKPRKYAITNHDRTPMDQHRKKKTKGTNNTDR
jgi:hypothetical protein